MDEKRIIEQMESTLLWSWYILNQINRGIAFGIRTDFLQIIWIFEKGVLRHGVWPQVLSLYMIFYFSHKVQILQPTDYPC